jgi:hypothetical protein
MACLDNRGLQKVSETPYYTRRDDSRTLETRYSRQRLHQKLRKVARAKHEVRLERPKMIEEYELVEERRCEAIEYASSIDLSKPARSLYLSAAAHQSPK